MRKNKFCKTLGELKGYRLVEMVATEHGVSDFKKLFEEARGGLFSRSSQEGSQKILLFVDEVHRLSKTRQCCSKESRKGSLFLWESRLKIRSLRQLCAAFAYARG